MTIRHRRSTALALACLITTGLLGLVPAGAASSAGAAENSPPVTRDDTVRVQAGDAAIAAVLKNDTDADGDELAICRLGKVPRNLEMYVEEAGENRRDDVGTRLVVFTQPNTAGRTFTITYYACDFDQLVPATLTVKVLRRPQVRVTKVAGRPGVLAVRNPSKYRLQFLWGAPRRPRPDGRVALPAGETIRVTVQRTAVRWVAFNRRAGVFNFGVVRNIEPPAPSASTPSAGGAPIPSGTRRLWNEASRG